MSRILFVDFDGVLHATGAGAANFSKLGLLADFLREPSHLDIQVVISSTWREVQSLAKLRAHFPPDLRERIVGSTPVLDEFDTNYQRSEEIEAWLEEQPADTWLALDDDHEGFPARNRANLVAVDPLTGLTPEIIGQLRTKVAIR